MSCNNRRICLAVASCAAQWALAVEEPAHLRTLEQITVIGSKQAITDIPGSASFLSEEDLAKHEYTDVMRLLGQVPGIYVMEEDGYGLRPNIGMRGTGQSRNDKITVMEDGVLAAPAAYSSPSAYYFPTIGRMQSIEVLKGTSSIMYGPRTTGGVLNLVSRAIPDHPLAGELELAAGEDGFGKLHSYVGGEREQLAGLVEIYRYQADGFKSLPTREKTGFVKNDYMAKLRINSNRASDTYQQLELKLKYSDEVSNETYLGLTDDDFARNPYRRYAVSQEDEMNTEHETVQLNHYLQLANGMELDSAVYYSDFHRNWYKTELAAGVASGFEAGLRGDTLPFSVRANNRDYISKGVQTQARLKLARHSLTAGIRYHEDEMDRFQWVDDYTMNRQLTTAMVRNGLPGTDSNRIDWAEAVAIFLHDEVSLGSWVISAGVRYEDMRIGRLDWGKTDPGRAQAPRTLVANELDALMPSLGATYTIDDSWILLAAVQRGFAPPAPGNAQSEEEQSWNYEAGFRYRGERLNAEVVAFFGDYDNMHGNCTVAQGCSEENLGDQFNAGKVEVKGLELEVSYLIEVDGFELPLTLAYTYSDTQFKRTFRAEFESWGTVAAGDELPYIPEHQIRLGVGLERGNWQADLGVRYLPDMRTKAGQGSIPVSELIEASTVLDLSASYLISDDQSLYLTIDNLLDEEYAATRTHGSLQPGKPQSVILGYRYSF